MEKIEIGDGQTYIFSVGGTAELHSGVIYEVKDCDAEYPINKHSIVELPPSFAVPTTSLIPDVLNTLAISCAATVEGVASTPIYLNSVSSGWTIDQEAKPPWTSTFGSHKNNLTTDISTPISNTFTFSSNSRVKAAALVLLSPDVAASSSSSSSS